MITTRLVDENGRDVSRCTHGCDTDEQCDILVIEVTPGTHLMHCSRFTAHGKPWHLRQRRRAARFRDTIEHFEDVSRNLRLNDPLARGQRIEILTQQRERSSYATVCQNGVGTCELNRCRGQTITKGKRDFFDVAPVRQIRQLAGALPGKAGTGRLAQSEAIQHIQNGLVSHRLRDLGDTHLTGFFDHR